ncbi:hypothetical protein JYB88_03070 [Shewanella cyperi]|uniref:DUF4760 domain-containing protein n=1 Tax=Shewanella cyperi TaxID=2814292 RepID=A0A974XLS9_9GAMM|nr:hypothetical protein [Shewanella cyperi]QSX30659.1 hypothetical protein JYB88_03070 [Shewanella cyperi]
MSKMEIAFITLVTGFILGNTVDFLKYQWKILRKKKAVIDEISDISHWMSEKIARIEEMIEHFVENGYKAHQIPSAIPTIIFDSHYSDVAPYFRREERKAIVDIFLSVKSYNEHVDNAKFDDAAEVKKFYLFAYSHCKRGQAAAEHFIANRDKSPLSLKSKALIRANDETQKFADKYRIL